jgi:hypothetical protein
LATALSKGLEPSLALRLGLACLSSNRLTTARCPAPLPATRG